MTVLELLQAREEVKQVVIDHAHALDTRDWEKLESLLTVDTRAEHGGSAFELTDAAEITCGRQDVIARYRKYLDNCGPTQHLVGNFCVEVHAGQAFSRCYVRAMHVGKAYLRTTLYDLWGIYEDELVATERGWKICRRVERAFHEIGDRSVYALDDEMV